MNGNTIIGMSFEAQTNLMSLLSNRPEHSDPSGDLVNQHSFKICRAGLSEERSAASLLIERMYATRGYETCPLAEHETFDRITLVANTDLAAVGTLTVGFDSPAGLLVDDLFLDEVNTLRESGRRVCEFTKFAVDRGVGSRQALAALFHVAYAYAHRIRHCDNLLIEVNPRHVRYYEAMLGFKVLGPERLNKRVNAPAVLLSLDLFHAREQISKFGGKPKQLSAKERSLYPCAFSASDEAKIIGKLRHNDVETAFAGLTDPLHAARHDPSTRNFH